MYEPYYIDRDPRPKTKPCQYCARDVEVSGNGRCTCVPSQPRHVPVTLVFFSGSRDAVRLQPEDRRTLRFLDEEPDI